MRAPQTLPAVLAALLVGVSCSSTGPAGLDAAGLTPAGSEEVPLYAPPPTYQLTAFDTSSLVISDGFGESIAVSFDASTVFRRALLNRFPTDPIHPCRDLAASYNTVATSDGFFAVISSMAASGCHAKIWIDLQTSTVRAFEPTLPPSPILPSNPI